jgi:hypothetical protein
MFRGNYDKADEMLRQYIYQSTRLKVADSADASGEQDYYKGMFGGMRRGGIGSGSYGLNSRDLPLSKSQYYELLELLVFYIWLPSKGYR